MGSLQYERMKVAAYSFDVRAGEPAANLGVVEAALREAARQRIELVALPEMWPTSFPVAALAGAELDSWLQASERSVERVRELSRELGLAVAGTSLARAPRAELAPRNRLQLFDAGRECLRYDKLHLFSPTAEHAQFSAGESEPTVADLCGLRVGAVICYDLRFGELYAPLHAARMDLLIVPAQWPIARAAHWRALAVGRAVETQAFVLAANRCGSAELGRRGERLEFPGNSLIVAPDGNVLAEGVAAGGWTVADIDVTQARELRVRVPMDKDRLRRARQAPSSTAES
jgi:predicted amidohydrolase